jgi:hypothetical protein
MFLKKELLQINKAEAKVMKKQLVIVGITLVLLAVGLSGCTNDNKSSSTPNGNTGTNETWTPGETSIGSVDNRIIGQWSARYETSDVGQYIFNFYANNTCKYTNTSTQQTLWARFGMFPNISFVGSDGRIAFKDGFIDDTAEYYWSNNNNTITIDAPNRENLIFTRQGTNEPETNGDTGTSTENIVGLWLGTGAIHGSQGDFYFYADGRYSYNLTKSYYNNSLHDVNYPTHWGEYTFIDNILTMDGTEFECVFSNNGNKMTIYQNGEANTVFTRQ